MADVKKTTVKRIYCDRVGEICLAGGGACICASFDSGIRLSGIPCRQPRVRLRCRMQRRGSSLQVVWPQPRL